MDRRVALVITDTRRGGTPNRVERLAFHASEQGWELTVISLMPGGPILGQLSKAGIDTVDLGIRRRSGAVAAAVQLRRELRRKRFDLVHSFLWHANALSRVVLIGSPTPLVNAHESVELEKPRARVLFDRRTVGLSDVHTAVTKEVARAVVDRDGVKPSSITIIPNGVSLDEWHRADRREDCRSTLGLGEGSRAVVWCGRVEAVKNLPLLVDALSLLPEWHLIVVGGGSRSGEVRSMGVARMGDRFNMIGEVSYVRPYLESGDVFCSTSLYEGMPLAVLEAMAMKVPVVAVPSAAGTLVQHGETGLVAVADPNALARRIEEALSRLDELVTTSSHHVRTRFSEERSLRAHLELWESLG